MRPPLVVVGTRPEAIKLVPVIQALQAAGVPARVCVTGQHREMVDQVLALFEVVPDHDLDIMRPGQDLFDVTSKTLGGLRDILAREAPSVVVVQGDTTTVLAASLASYYQRVPVAHVEAGLRTGDRFAPFPEEMNRRLTSVLADYHFAPTEQARANLLREGQSGDRIWVTGNTGIDTLVGVARRFAHLPEPPGLKPELAAQVASLGAGPERIILVTGHRRESFGAGFEQITRALRDLAERNPGLSIVYPVHLNPHVQEPVRRVLGDQPRVHLLEPLPYAAFVWLMARSHLILTDSGGIQEEAPALGKPVLVMRSTTERPEAVEAGTSRLVGTDRARIVAETETLLHDEEAYQRMARVVNPFGDGKASQRIVDILLREVPP